MSHKSLFKWLAIVVGVLIAPVNGFIEIHFIPLNGGGRVNLNGMQFNGVKGGNPVSGPMTLQEFSKLFPDMPAIRQSRGETSATRVDDHHIASGDHESPVQIISSLPMMDPLMDSLIASIMHEMPKHMISHDPNEQGSSIAPIVLEAQKASRQAKSPGGVHPCAPDVERLCVGKGHEDHAHMSRLHCLGLHADEISEACGKEVETALPFICAPVISNHCTSVEDVVERSVLACVEDFVKSRPGEAGVNCEDSVRATRAAIGRFHGAKSLHVKDTRSGSFITSVEELKLGVQKFAFATLLVLAVMLFGWIYLTGGSRVGAMGKPDLELTSGSSSSSSSSSRTRSMGSTLRPFNGLMGSADSRKENSLGPSSGQYGAIDPSKME